MAIGDSTLYIRKGLYGVVDNDTGQINTNPGTYTRLVNSQVASIVLGNTTHVDNAFSDGHVDLSFWLRTTNTSNTYQITVTITATDAENTVKYTVGQKTITGIKFSSSKKQITTSININDTLYPADFTYDPNYIYGFWVKEKYGSGALYFCNQQTVAVDAYYYLPTAPAVPVVTATPSSLNSGRSLLTWPASEAGVNNPAAGYKIYRRESTAGAQFEQLEDGYTTGLQFTVDSAEGKNNYYDFAVSAIGTISGWDSALSTPVRVTTEWDNTNAPAAPALSAESVYPGSSVILYWSVPAAALNNPVAAYRVYRYVDGGEPELIDTVTGTNCTVTAPITNVTRYQYSVVSVGSVSGYDSGYSSLSNNLTCHFEAPTAPSGLLINGKSTVYADAGTDHTLTWSAGSDGQNNPIQFYRIYRNGVIIGTTTELQYTVTSSSVQGTILQYYVTAVGLWSASPASNTVLLTTNVAPIPQRSYTKVTEFMFFDRDDNMQFVRGDAITLTVTEQEYKCNGSFAYDPDRPINCGMRIGWLEGEQLLLFEIRQCTTDAVLMIQTFEAEHIALAQLLDIVIQDVRPQNKTAEYCVTQALTGSGWSVGNVTFGTDTGTTNFYYCSVWAALCKIRDDFGCVISPRLAYTYDGIQRYIDILTRRGSNRGVRLTLDLNAQTAGITYDDRQQYTALYGRGASEETDNGGYTRLKTFAESYWSTANGDPANKPVGQQWVEDTAATALYGRNGVKRVGLFTYDTIDADELLQKTWQALQEYKTPQITIEMTAFDLSTIGYAAQGLAWGDDVTVVLTNVGIEVMARITSYERDVLQPENSRPVIGSYRTDLVYDLASESLTGETLSSGGGAAVDPTLTIEGMAADSKATGDAITSASSTLNSRIDGKQDALTAGEGISITGSTIACSIDPSCMTQLWSGNQVLNASAGFTLSQYASNYRLLYIKVKRTDADYSSGFFVHPESAQFQILMYTTSLTVACGNITWSNNKALMKFEYKLRFYKTSATAGGSFTTTHNVTAIYGIK